MRNLKTVAAYVSQIPDGLALTATAWDTSHDGSAIICAFGPTPAHARIELKRKTHSDPEYTVIASWDAPCPLPELPSDEVLLLQYFSGTKTTCLVLAGGDIILVREDPLPGQERVEIVGSVDVGISAAAWAPDEELLALVTRSDTLVLMSRDFEPVTETTLSAEDLNASKHVSVGWGKKETQFQGKRAKAMRDPTVPETTDEGKPSSREDGCASISWRGDGAYFAVNNVVPDHRRVIRVFDREGKLDSASEPVDGLESTLSWRPYGNLIAGIKRSLGKVEVVFLERNGLRHGEFDLRLSADDMQTWASRISLIWNIDSTVLAVCYLDRFQLWTMGNYHYYLKQEIPVSTFSKSDKAPIALRWHPEAPLRLFFSRQDSIQDLKFLLTVSRGSLTPPDDKGIVAVIDGKTLKLTPLRQAVVPPPMSFCEVRFDHNITDCAISPNGERLVVITAETLELCTWPTQYDTPLNEMKRTSLMMARCSPTVEKRSLSFSAVMGTSQRHVRYTQVKLKGNTEIFLLGFSKSTASAKIYSLNWPEADIGEFFSEHEVGSDVQNIFTDTRHESIWASDPTSTLMLTTEVSQLVLLPPALGTTSPDTSIFRLPLKSSEEPNGYHEPVYHKVSLSSKGILQVDNHILARGCSSFVVTDAHLIFTTTQHLLKLVHLTEPANMEVPDNTPEADERCRSIERGAKTVTAMPSAYAVVLQMPRGNLETIHPRVLVLTGIRNHLENLDYKTAFLACQNHQVDLNILHDFNPSAFFTNTTTFITQLKKPSRIDEFLSKLKDEDVTQTLYRDTLKQALPTPTTPTCSSSASKVNKICSALLAALSTRSTYVQSTITAHVCKRPPDLTSALMLVSNLHTTSPPSADAAISHLCFLTDSTKLYNTALSLYDLEVTLLIAQHSQRDPREYMPFLQNLNSLPELRKQYTIDNHLKNYARALESLVALESHPEAEAYCVKHILYITALSLYKYSPPHTTHYTSLYAAHLASTSQPLAAALLYDSLQNYALAYPLYATAHHWRESLTCASLIPLEPPALKNLALSLATTLKDEHRDYRSAASIHVTYLSDAPTAASLLCRGCYFSEALLLLSQHHPTSTSPTLISSIIDPNLHDKSSEILSLINDCKSQLSTQVPRILELRAIKAADPLAFYGGDTTTTILDDSIPDNISLAPTDSTLASHSLFTRYNPSDSRFGGTLLSTSSRKTSKTKRKEERKRARGKKGSVYEEEYLVASVSRLIGRVNGVHDEARRLLMGLVRRGMREQAERVSEAMAEIGAACEKVSGEVWPKAERGGAEAAGPEGEVERRPRGGEGVLWDAQQEAEEEKKGAPEVKVWKGGLSPT